MKSEKKGYHQRASEAIQLHNENWILEVVVEVFRRQVEDSFRWMNRNYSKNTTPSYAYDRYSLGKKGREQLSKNQSFLFNKPMMPMINGWR
mgnify:CR=1 FL=1